MIASDLLRSWNTAPRVHPNGFIQIDSPDPAMRVHIWPNEPLQAQKTQHPIHDHVFDMESRIVKGAMTNITYNFIRSQFAHPEYEIFKAHYVNAHESQLKTTEERGHMNMMSRITYPAGRKYSLLRDIFHDSKAHGTTVTVMKKSNMRTPQEPRIAVPYGMVPDNDYRRDSAPVEHLWKTIEATLDGIKDSDILN